MTGRRFRLPPGPAALAEVGLMFLPGIPAYLWLWPAVTGTPWGMPTQVAVYLYLLAGTLLIGLRRWRLRELGLHGRGVGLSLACGLAFVAGRTLVLMATNLPAGPRPLEPARLAGEVGFYFGLVGVAEELLFRGLIYRALEEWRGTRLAIWGSSLAFGMYHVGGQGPIGGLGTFIVGLIFAAIRWRAGGIVGLILVHGLTDLAAVEMAPRLVAEGIGRVQILSPALLAAGYALIIAVPLYLWKLMR